MSDSRCSWSRRRPPCGRTPRRALIAALVAVAMPFATACGNGTTLEPSGSDDGCLDVRCRRAIQWHRDPGGTIDQGRRSGSTRWNDRDLCRNPWIGAAGAGAHGSRSRDRHVHRRHDIGHRRHLRTLAAGHAQHRGRRHNRGRVPPRPLASSSAPIRPACPTTAAPVPLPPRSSTPAASRSRPYRSPFRRRPVPLLRRLPRPMRTASRR